MSTVDEAFGGLNPKHLFTVTTMLECGGRAQTLFWFLRDEHGVKYVGDLIQLTERELGKFDGVGPITLGSIKAALKKMDLVLGTEVPNWPKDDHVRDELARRFEDHY